MTMLHTITTREPSVPPPRAVTGAHAPGIRPQERPTVAGPTGDRPSPGPRDRAEASDIAADLDRFFRSRIGRLTFGVSPAGLLLAHLDWWVHLAGSPGKQLDLIQKWLRRAVRLSDYAARACVQPGCSPVIEPLPQDQRFSSPAWGQWPFNVYYQSFLLLQQWVHNATTGVRGVSPHAEQVVTFLGRQDLDKFAPTNFIATNPDVLAATCARAGPTWSGARSTLPRTGGGPCSARSRRGRRRSPPAEPWPSRQARSSTATGSSS